MSKATKESSSKSKLDLALEKIEKEYGTGSIMGAKDVVKDIDAISTGSFNLDKALGIGGLPRGRVVEAYGPESSGKTTLCISVIAECHKADPTSTCAIVDAEHALDLKYAEALGVDLSRLKIAQPSCGEEALEIARLLIESGEVSVVVIDSVAALVPKSELEGEIGDASVGKQARMMSQALRILTGVIEKSNTLVIFTNQIRQKIGIMFGDPRTTTGGDALKFYASIRMEIARVTTNKDDDVAISNKVRVKVIKNKVASPYTQAEFNIIFGEGIDRKGEILDNAIEMGIIKKSGSWYSHNGVNVGQGEAAVMQLFTDNPEFYKDIENQVLNKNKPHEENSEAK